MTTTTTWQPQTTTTWPSETTTSWPATTTEWVSCPDGWVDFGASGCFLLSTEVSGVTWWEAAVFCEEQDGFLAEPKTSEQLQFLTSLAFVEESLTGIQGWWTGLVDFNHEGSWMWEHSGDEASWDLPWDSSCPDYTSHNTRDCAALVSNSVPDQKEYAALFRDLNCLERVEDFAMGVACQRGGS